MRIIIQRVKQASVVIDKKTYSSINSGLLCLVGFCNDDTKDDFIWASNKVLNLKVFKDEKSLKEIKGGGLLIVSQFTLFASIKKGMKPSWSKAANASSAQLLYNQFIDICKEKEYDNIQTGVFGANMDINSINDGPFTLMIDTKKRE